jgi:hypothetical protein
MPKKKAQIPPFPGFAKTTSVSPEPPTELDLPEAYKLFAPRVSELSKQAIQVCRADLRLVYANIRTGVAAIAPHTATLTMELPALPVKQILDLPNLAGALLYASQRCEEATASKGEIQACLKKVRKLREPMLMVAEALAMLGHVSSERVARIRAGTGAYDAALDAVALAELYKELDGSLHSKHPFTEEQITQAAELGTWLVRHITPTGARALPNPAADEAHHIRDGLWTLLVRDFPLVRKAGFYLFGEDVNTYVPLLMSRELRSSSKMESVTAIPVATPTNSQEVETDVPALSA